MTWVRFDDQASIHRKVAPLDDATYRLWREAIEWSSRNLTDGQISLDELADVSKRATKPRAAKLVERTLWHAAGHECPSDKCPPAGPNGWVIHDYLDYQPSKAQARAELAAKAERTRKWRERKGVGDASRDGSRDASSNGSRDGPVMLPRPVPSRPAPKEAGTGRPRGSSPPAPLRGPTTSQDQTTSVSLKCPRCMNAVDSAYHLRICVPSEAEESA